MSAGILLQDTLTPTKWVAAKADYVTGAAPVVDNDHAYIHEGRAFSAFIYDESTGTGTLGFALVTPASTSAYPYVHFRPKIATTDKPLVEIKMYEGSSASSTMGSAVSLINHNRNSTAVSGCSLRSGITTTPSSTKLISHSFLGGGTGQGQTAFGSQAEGVHEWVLKPGTVYQIDYERGTADTKIGIEFFHYEEAGG